MPLAPVMFGTGLTGTGAHPYSLFINGLDVIKEAGNPGSLFGTVVDSVRLHETLGRPPTLQFTVDDPAAEVTISAGADVYFCNQATLNPTGTGTPLITEDLFRGVVTSRELVPHTAATGRRWEVTANGLEILLHRRVIPSGAFRVGMNTNAAIQVLMAYYGDQRLIALSRDTTALNGGGAGFQINCDTLGSDIPLTGKTTYEALSDVIKADTSFNPAPAFNEYAWMPNVDAQGRLRVNPIGSPFNGGWKWFKEGIAAASAPWRTHASPTKINVDVDSTRLVNAVYVQGVDQAASGWVIDASSIAQYGRMEAYVETDIAVSAATRDRFGIAYLAEHGPITRIEFRLEGARDGIYSLGTTDSPGLEYPGGWHVRNFSHLISSNGLWTDGLYALVEMTQRWEGGGTHITLDLDYSGGRKSGGGLLSQQTTILDLDSRQGGRLVGTLGEVAVRTKAGTPTDADFDIARDGFLVLDTTSNSLWMRSGGTWRRMASSAMVGCVATRAATQSIGSGSFVAIDFNSTDISDPFGFHDPGSNPSRFTVPEGLDGTYLCIGQVQFVSLTQRVQASWAKNGAATVGPEASTIRPAGSTDPARFQHSHVIELVAGDYVEFNVYQLSGGALNYEADGWATVYRLGEVS